MRIIRSCADEPLDRARQIEGLKTLNVYPGRSGRPWAHVLTTRSPKEVLPKVREALGPEMPVCGRQTIRSRLGLERPQTARTRIPLAPNAT